MWRKAKLQSKIHHMTVGSTWLPFQSVPVEGRINAPAGCVGEHAEDTMFWDEHPVVGYIQGE